MSEILKVLELAQEHGVSEMKIGRSRIESGFHAQRLAGRKRLLQLGAQLRLLHNFSGAFLDVGELFVNGGEGGHEQTLLQKTCLSMMKGRISSPPSA